MKLKGRLQPSQYSPPPCLAPPLCSNVQEAGKAYDATELVRGYSGPQLPVLMDTGLDDEFLKTQVGRARDCSGRKWCLRWHACLHVLCELKL